VQLLSLFVHSTYAFLRLLDKDETKKKDKKEKKKSHFDKIHKVKSKNDKKSLSFIQKKLKT
jgi:hypothetical protein